MNFSKLSEILTGSEFRIRKIDNRDKIPKKYFPALSELIEVMEAWEEKHGKPE